MASGIVTVGDKIVEVDDKALSVNVGSLFSMTKIQTNQTTNFAMLNNTIYCFVPKTSTTSFRAYYPAGPFYGETIAGPFYGTIMGQGGTYSARSEHIDISAASHEDKAASYTQGGSLHGVDLTASHVDSTTLRTTWRSVSGCYIQVNIAGTADIYQLANNI